MMRKSIILSNGELYIGLDKSSQIRQMTYPYVGQDQVIPAGSSHKLGVFVDGKVSWLDDESWSISQQYPHSALISQTVARNNDLGVVLEIDDTVDGDLSAFIRNIHVVNQSSEQREIKIFAYQRFMISNADSPADCAYITNDKSAVVHYHGSRYFAVSGQYRDGSFDDYTIGLYGDGLDGTWRDAEDGVLSKGSVDTGRVDSTVGFTLSINGHSSERMHYWLAAGKSEREVLFVHRKLCEDGLVNRFQRTAKSWQVWLEPISNVASRLTHERKNRFIVSAMVLKAHFDTRGAFMENLSESDGDDMPLYAWPRVGAYAIWPLIRLGYVDEPIKFFEFCSRSVKGEGYFVEKYLSDGSPAPSKFARIRNDLAVDPTAIDQMAIVTFIFSEFYRLHKNPKMLSNFFSSLVVPLADYIVRNIDDQTSLPVVNYSLWNKPTDSCIYTASVVHAALAGASELAEAMDDKNRMVEYRAAADDLFNAAEKHLVDSEGLIQTDGKIDAANIFGGFIFGLFAPEGPEMKSSVAKAVDVFGRLGECGLAKSADYSSERYLVPTLWYAEYCLEVGDDQTADSIISWIESCASETGLLPEKIDSCDDIHFDTPSLWSQAEYMTAVLDSLTNPDSQ